MSRASSSSARIPTWCAGRRSRNRTTRPTPPPSSTRSDAGGRRRTPRPSRGPLRSPTVPALMPMRGASTCVPAATAPPGWDTPCTRMRAAVVTWLGPCGSSSTTRSTFNHSRVCTGRPSWATGHPGGSPGPADSRWKEYAAWAPSSATARWTCGRGRCCGTSLGRQRRAGSCPPCSPDPGCCSGRSGRTTSSRSIKTRRRPGSSGTPSRCARPTPDGSTRSRRRWPPGSTCIGALPIRSPTRSLAASTSSGSGTPTDRVVASGTGWSPPPGTGESPPRPPRSWSRVGGGDGAACRPV